MISLLGEDSEDISMWQLLVQEAADIVSVNSLDEHIECISLFDSGTP